MNQALERSDVSVARDAETFPTTYDTDSLQTEQLLVSAGPHAHGSTLSMSFTEGNAGFGTRAQQR